LGTEVVSDVEDQFRMIIATERYEAAEAREQDIKQRYEERLSRTDLAMVAMHDKLEDKATRREEFWVEKLQTMKEEHDRMNSMYLNVLDQQKELVRRSADRTQSVKTMSEEVELLRRENEVLKENREAKLWLDMEYPQGYKGTDILRMPEVVRGLAAQYLRQKKMMEVTEEKHVEEDSRGAKRVILPPRYTQVVGVEHTTLGKKIPEGGIGIQEVDNVFYDQEKLEVSKIEEVEQGEASQPGGDTSTPKTLDPTQICLQQLTTAVINIQKQHEASQRKQEMGLQQVRAELCEEFSRQQEGQKKVRREEIEEVVRQASFRGEHEDRVAGVTACMGQLQEKYSRDGPSSSQNCRGKTDDREDVMFDEQMKGLTRAHYELPEHGAEEGVPSTPGKDGYLPTRFLVPKHEEQAVGLFYGGEEARTKWPEYYANFEHVASAYGWGDGIKGVLLFRRSRSHALHVIKTLPEKKKLVYKSLIEAFHKAYVPSQWARAYRGAMAKRKQKENESFLHFAADLRKIALLAYPCTDPANDDAVREDRCLDVFLNGIRSSQVAVYVTDKAPSNMEEAISAAEAYSAIVSKDEITENLPLHPDEVPSPTGTSGTQGAVADASERNPRNNPNGQRYPRKEGRKDFKKGDKPFKKDYQKEDRGRQRGGRGGGKEKPQDWDNSFSAASKIMLQMLEEMCKVMKRGNPQGAPTTRGQQGYDKMGEKRGQQGYDKGGEKRRTDNWISAGEKKLQIRCFRCQKPGHYIRECKANAFAVDDYGTGEWYCEDHVMGQEDEEEEGF
jgi:hypothetical protein